MEPVRDSVSNYGTATAPADDAAIATIAASDLPAGRYHVRVRYGFGGTAGNLDGFEFRRAGVIQQILPISATANSEGLQIYERVITVDGTQTLTITANGAGGVGSVYSAEIVATPIVGE